MRTIVIAFILMCTISLSAQDNREKREERIRTFKVGFLTERLELSSKEAQDFWPVYNEFDKKMEGLRKSEFEVLRSARQDKDNLTEAQAEDILSMVLDVEQKRAIYKTELAKKLTKVIPVKKILALFKAEEDFKRRLLKELRNKRGQRSRN